MKNIVVPTDFSAISLNAARYAADLACVIEADVTLIHVCQFPMSFSEVPAPSYSVTEMVLDAELQIRELREEIEKRTGDKIDIHTEVREGDVMTEIDEYCNSVDPYAVVMGTENAGAFERFLFGGKTVSAVRQLPWPLIMVPPGIKFENIRKIGLACDFKKVAETLPVREIRSLVEKFHAELHILHGNSRKGDALDEETCEESGRLQDIIADLNPRYHFISCRDIETGIVEFAEQNKIDLLIIIPKKHSLLSQVLHHSRSRRMVLHTHVPVMAIHE